MMITQDPPPLYLYNLMLSVSFCYSAIYCYRIIFALHKLYIADVSFRQFRIAKRNYYH